jgi:transcriptional regulator with XRE-family HTH domain
MYSDEMTADRPSKGSNDGRSERLREARVARGFDTAAAAADAFSWNRNTYASNENGNAPFSYRKAKDYAVAFGVRPEWLYDAAGPMRPTLEPGYVAIVGMVGANPEGIVLFAMGQEPTDLAPIPPGGTEKAAALRVAGHSMRGVADDGALIYFEGQHASPTRDHVNRVVVVELETGEVLLKRLLRGEEPGTWDLESIVGPTLQNVRIRWVASVTAIVPPPVSQRIIVRAHAA